MALKFLTVSTAALLALTASAGWAEKAGDIDWYQPTLGVDPYDGVPGAEGEPVERFMPLYFLPAETPPAERVDAAREAALAGLRISIRKTEPQEGGPDYRAMMLIAEDGSDPIFEHPKTAADFASREDFIFDPQWAEGGFIGFYDCGARANGLDCAAITDSYVKFYGRFRIEKSASGGFAMTGDDLRLPSYTWYDGCDFNQYATSHRVVFEAGDDRVVRLVGPEGALREEAGC